MSVVKGLLVDLDGTLVDTSDANFAAYEAALAQFGVILTREWWAAHGFGRSWRQFLPDLLRGRDDVDPRAVADAKSRLYPEFLHRSRRNTALVSLIESLRPRVRTALVTTASKAGTDAVIDRHGLRTLFDTIVTGDDVTAHKPSPDAFAEAARRLDLGAADCLVIEDSAIGIAAARAFGAPCLVVPEIAR